MNRSSTLLAFISACALASPLLAQQDDPIRKLEAQVVEKYLKTAGAPLLAPSASPHADAKVKLVEELHQYGEAALDVENADAVAKYVSDIAAIIGNLKKLSEGDEKTLDAVGNVEKYLEKLKGKASKTNLTAVTRYIAKVDLPAEAAAVGYRRQIEELLALPADAAHSQLLQEKEYVSATKCQTCHPQHFEQWSLSQHAYSQISPVYMAMQNAINTITSGTNGDFCIRCHTQVGMNKSESTYLTNVARHPASREGITCIVCHRISPGNELAKGTLPYGKVSGRMGIMEADLNGEVFGPRPSDEVKVAIDAVKGQAVHVDSVKFNQITTSAFCGTCHDVNLFNGFRLEEAFSEYKNAEAAKKGISCQDCHMGVEQGVAQRTEAGTTDAKRNYHMGMAATSSTGPRKLTNHMFAGPDHSVVHPGIFPTDDRIVKMATTQEWLDFNFAAGWGSKIWEDQFLAKPSPEDMALFAPNDAGPFRWMYPDDRKKAREVIFAQFKRLEAVRAQRLVVLRNGYQLADTATGSNSTENKIKVHEASLRKGISFEIGVKNATDGHGVPTGFIAERLVWLSVDVTKVGQDLPVFQSGDLDPNGDVRDAHSIFVHNGDSRWRIADGYGAQRLLVTPSRPIEGDSMVPVVVDLQLFNLQSNFITVNIRGGEREQILAVNHSVDVLPFIRPSTNSTILTGQPGAARIHRKNIAVGTIRDAEYKVKSSLLDGPGDYRIDIQLKAGMVPVNLLTAINGDGFDYGMSTKDIARRVVFGFQMETDAMRYFAFRSVEERNAVTSNAAYRQKAQQMHAPALRVLNDADAALFLDLACVNLYAQDVQRKKVDFAMKRLKALPEYETIRTADYRYPWAIQAIEANAIDGVADLSAVLERWQQAAPARLETVDEVLAILRSDKFENDYWSTAEIYEKNHGLLIGKVAGHEVLDTTTHTVTVKP